MNTFRRISILILLVSIAVLSAACGSSSNSDENGDADSVDSEPDGDDDGEAEFESEPEFPRTLTLNDGWRISSSVQTGEDGQSLSRVGYSSDGWLEADLPATVLAAQVSNGEIEDPFFGERMRDLPGYTSGLFPITDDSPYKAGWWYRIEFPTPEGVEDRRVILSFEGINYRADVWLNGDKIGAKERIVGTFRRFEFDVSASLADEGENALALLIFAPDTYDLAISWVDWNPTPPDRNMGLWQDVLLHISGPIKLSYPAIITDSIESDGQSASLRASAELHNYSDSEQKAVLKVAIEGVEIEKEFTLSPENSQRVELTAEEFAALVIDNPRLWWPRQMGSPELYSAEFSVEVNGEVSDRSIFDFGIRTIIDEFTSEGARLFKINGVPLLIRGAGWASDIFLREDQARWDAELEYVLDLGLNTIRLEGKLENQRFIEKCDRLGILVLAGWCCCDGWERWESWEQEQYDVAPVSLDHQIMRLRRHPSLLAWMNGSDFHPIAEVEREYIKVIEDASWPNPVISNATEDPSEVSGPSGVKMEGPYDWIAPNYWLEDEQFGGAFNFNTETGPGPAVPQKQSLEKMLPSDDIWPIDDVFNFHVGGGAFTNMNIMLKAIEMRHGEPADIDDLIMKSDLIAYEAQRAMFEAFSRNKYIATGVIQWMLNDAWPSVLWHLYDYYLLPLAGYYGSKTALRPLHLMYSYDDYSVWLMNTSYEYHDGLKAEVKIYDTASTQKYSTMQEDLSISPDNNKLVFSLGTAIEEMALSNGVYLLYLKLLDSEGTLIEDSVYWMNTTQDVPDWENNEWNYCPTKSYADLKPLSELEILDLDINSSIETAGDDYVVSIELRNQTQVFSLFNRLELRCSDGLQPAPVIWSDNYISLPPGSLRNLTARISRDLCADEEPYITLTGWNSRLRSAQ